MDDVAQENLQSRFPAWSLFVLALSNLIVGCAPKSAEEQLAAVDQNYQEVSDRYMTAFKAATTKEQEDETWAICPNREYFTKRYLAIAERFPDTPVAASALSWIARKGDGNASEEAVIKLFQSHADSPVMSEVATRIRSDERDPDTEKRLQHLIDDSPHKQVVAAARYSLAYLYSKLMITQSALSNPKFVKKHHSKRTIEYWQDLAVDDSEIGTLLELALDGFDGDNSEFGQKIASRCRSMLFERNHLQPGQPAPETVGIDIFGKPFRLSDFRGKVVLLSFWGDW